MVWKNDYGNDSDVNSLIYDLRQTYAEILGTILKQIMLARQGREYVKWFELLEDLFIEINQKLEKEERKSYQIKLNKAKDIISRNEFAFQGQSKDTTSHYEIRLALSDLEMYIKRLMEDHKMFGSVEDDEGL